VPLAYVNYFPWLADPDLVKEQKDLKIGCADGSGNNSIYYKVSLGDDGSGVIANRTPRSAFRSCRHFRPDSSRGPSIFI
ncbi:MAG: hypothetical protein AB8E74_09370, partial [Prochlorococcus sp.]